jgi:hypothetical protein
MIMYAILSGALAVIIVVHVFALCLIGFFSAIRENRRVL